MQASGPDSMDAALEWLRKHFDAEAARGVSAVYRIELSGPDGGSFGVAIRDGVLHLTRGEGPEPGVVLRLAAPDYFAVLAGRENADLLYMAGRLEIEGDLSLAMKLRTLFRPPA